MKSLKERLSNKWVTWDTKLLLYTDATLSEREQVNEFIEKDIIEAYEKLGEDYCRMILAAHPDSCNVVHQFLDEYKEITDPQGRYKKDLREILRRIELCPSYTPDCSSQSFYYLFRNFKILNLNPLSSFDVMDILWFFWIVEKNKEGGYNIIQEYSKNTFDTDDLFFLIFNERLNYESIFRIYINFDRPKRTIFEEENIYPDMIEKLKVLGFARIMEFKFNKKKLDLEMHYIMNTLRPIFMSEFSKYTKDPFAVNLDYLIKLYDDIYSGLRDKRVQNERNRLFDLSLLCPQRFSYSFINYDSRKLL